VKENAACTDGAYVQIKYIMRNLYVSTSANVLMIGSSALPNSMLLFFAFMMISFFRILTHTL
jgi:hypothetical protein